VPAITFAVTRHDLSRGASQAARTLADIANGAFDYQVVWMDVELPGIRPAPDNGWNNVYTSPCGGVIRHAGTPAAVDRDGTRNRLRPRYDRRCAPGAVGLGP
jgi:hypothetical protein